MKLELKTVKIAHNLSEETTAYTAELWCDGRLVAHCKNDGQGGADYYHWSCDHEVSRTIEAWAKSLPDVDLGHGFLAKSDLELVVGGLLEAHQQEQQFRKWCRKNIVFRVEGVTPIDVWNHLTTLNRARAVEFIEKKYPGKEYVILNDRFTNAATHA